MESGDAIVRGSVAVLVAVLLCLWVGPRVSAPDEPAVLRDTAKPSTVRSEAACPLRFESGGQWWCECHHITVVCREQ